MPKPSPVIDPLNKLLELAEQQARLVLLALRHPQLVPSWVLLNADGKINVLATPWADDREKNNALSYLRAEMRKRETVAYSHLGEAWIAHYELAELPPDFNAKSELAEVDKPRNRLDRREVVMAIATDGKEVCGRNWEIIRNWDGKIGGLAPIELAKGQIPLQGRFTELLS